MTVSAIETLGELYRQGNLVPFIGAGLSSPFKIPTWEELIRELTNKNIEEPIKPTIELYLKRKDYWQAVELLMDIGHLDEMDIQQGIVNLINERQIKPEKDELHNYCDLGKMNFNNYLTTNYDHWIYEYLSDKTYIPQVLSKVDISTQRIIHGQNQRVWHLHGNISDPGTIVLSRNKYNELYTSKRYEKLLSLFTATCTLMFIGFSFDDQYIRQLIKDHKSYFKGNHYILLDRPSDQVVHELKMEYGLNVIAYDTTKSNHVSEIRRILNEIEQTATKSNPSIKNPPSSMLIDSIPDTKAKKKVENNLFCKKIKIEDINDYTLERSKEYFIYADQYIRKLRKNCFNKNIVKTILSICYMKFRDVEKDDFLKYADSQRFIDRVHEELGIMEYDDAVKNSLKNARVPYYFENKGFIHTMADDLKYDVWWGFKRF